MPSTRPNRVDGRRHHRLDLGLLHDVRQHTEGLDPEGLELRHCCVQQLRLPFRRDDLRTTASQVAGDAEADAAPGPGHDDHAPLDLVHCQRIAIDHVAP